MADKPQEYTDFPLEFYNEVNEDGSLYDEFDRRMRRLAKDHTDITGASMNLRQNDKGSDRGYEATAVVYARPTNLSATAASEQPQGAVKGALDAIERQVREQRDRLRGY